MVTEMKSNLKDFRDILVRLIDNEFKLKTEIVKSLYEQVFINEAFIQSYADKEIDEVYNYLVQLKQYYSLSTLKDVKEHLKKFDKLTERFINFYQGRTSHDKEIVKSQIERITKDTNRPITELSFIDGILNIDYAEKHNMINTQVRPKPSAKKKRNKLSKTKL